MRGMVGERIEEGFAALTLESDARGGLVAVFVLEAGMICCSLRHRGEELLGQRNGLRAYVDQHYWPVEVRAGVVLYRRLRQR